MHWKSIFEHDNLTNENGFYWKRRNQQKSSIIMNIYLHCFWEYGKIFKGMKSIILFILMIFWNGTAQRLSDCFRQCCFLTGGKSTNVLSQQMQKKMDFIHGNHACGVSDSRVGLCRFKWVRRRQLCASECPKRAGGALFDYLWIVTGRQRDDSWGTKRLV